MSQSDRIAEFRRLHASGCFVIPNPWDRGSAVILASLGFRALATSSAALAYRLARDEKPGSLSLEETLDNVREIVEATELPVNADFQSGYARPVEGVAGNVVRCVETGVAGLSIEDTPDDRGKPLYDASEALERVQAAREAIRSTGRDVVLTARCEAFLVGHPDPLQTVLERLVAFAEAGADCLFAPGMRTREEIREVVAAVAPKPVNVLARDPGWMTVDALSGLGVRRISVGSALARVAMGSFLRASREIASSGSFHVLEDAEPFETLDSVFSKGARR